MERHTTERDRQRTMNPSTLEQLAAKGSDLSLTHHLVNVFIVAKETELGSLVSTLERSGFQIEDRGSLQSDNDTQYWLVEASIDSVPAIGFLNDMTDGCVGMAETCGVEYDGWYTQVVGPMKA